MDRPTAPHASSKAGFLHQRLSFWAKYITTGPQGLVLLKRPVLQPSIQERLEITQASRVYQMWGSQQAVFNLVAVRCAHTFTSCSSQLILYIFIHHQFGYTTTIELDKMINSQVERQQPSEVVFALESELCHSTQSGRSGLWIPPAPLGQRQNSSGNKQKPSGSLAPSAAEVIRFTLRADLPLFFYKKTGPPHDTCFGC